MLLVFKIAPVAGEGKVKIVHQNLLLPFGGNIKGGPENEGNWQNVDEPQDCILAVSGHGVQGIEDVLTDPKPVDDCHAIIVQHVQTVEKLNYWVKTVCRWVQSLYRHQKWKTITQRYANGGSLVYVSTSKMLTWLWMAWCVFQVWEKLGGEGYVFIKYVSGKNCPQLDR